MAKVAVVQTKPSKAKLNFSFDFDNYYLCSDPSIKKVYKKHVDIDFNPDEYDWVILVGSDAFKFYTGKTGITEFSGKLVQDKFLPAINPGMLAFKPEMRNIWEMTVDSIEQFVEGTGKKARIPYENYEGIQDYDRAMEYLQEAFDSPNAYVGLDSETSALDPRQGYMLGFSISYRLNYGAYIDAELIDDAMHDLMQAIFLKKTVVFHNAKFDLAWFKYHYKFDFPQIEDTMLLHYALDERPGTHGLKKLAVKYTIYGDYEEQLGTWVKEYCNAKGILKSDFSYALIPFEVMHPYASMDAGVTLVLFNQFRPILNKNNKLRKLYEEVLLPALRFIMDMEDNGVPFDKARLEVAKFAMTEKIEAAEKELLECDEVKRFIADNGEFNPNSVLQLRKLLFDYVGLRPTGIMTGTGKHSTNAEVLGILAEDHKIPALILTIRKFGKIRNTYLDKIGPALNMDSRLRTNFNLHSTTSGRLSSSGKLNMQQLPRDEPSVKGCIKAGKGKKIVAMDLKTAEVYGAAVLSGDKALQEVFTLGKDFHSTIAHKVFKLECAIEEVKELYPGLRQAAKAVTFGIMYGAGPKKISEQVTKDNGVYFSPQEAKEVIDDYFREFHMLKKWIDNNTKFIEANGYIYSHFGRKRRLRNVKSDNKAIIGGEIRSGLNFLVQSIASDINLLGAIDCHKMLGPKGLSKHVKIFALVHDSVLAEVDEDYVEPYIELLRECIQVDRGLSIPGHPITCDFDVADDYSLGKFDKLYGEVSEDN